MKKILALTKYDNLGASSRLRTYQYLDHLDNDIIIKISFLFSNKYIERFYSKKFYLHLVFYSYFKRLLFLPRVFKYDLIIIEKEILPFFPSIFEYLFYVFKIKYIVDYDDAVFHTYDQHKTKLIRRLFSNKIKNVMSFSYKVICGNKYILDYAKTSKASNLVYLPTVVSNKRYSRFLKKNQSNKNDKIVIGWIGTPYTSKHLYIYISLFEKISKELNVCFRFIGLKKGSFKYKEFEFIDWSEESEVSHISSFDIGIMPLNDDSFSKGKCAYKLIQYMALSIPVIGSPVGANEQVIKQNTNGFLANSLNDWEFYLKKLILDSDLRKKMGNEGRKIFLDNFSLESKTDLYNSILKN